MRVFATMSLYFTSLSMPYIENIYSYYCCDNDEDVKTCFFICNANRSISLIYNNLQNTGLIKL
jgi:hypothetical protein